MSKTRILATAAFIGAVALSGAASAQTAATATTDLNIRSGPGPQHPVVGYNMATEGVTISG